MAGYLLVRNPQSGSQADEELAAEARRRLPDVDSFDLEPRADLAGAIDRALLEDRVVVAAGGDGTVNAVAQHLVARGTLGILPGGTLNHFARDLGVRDPARALQALERGQPRAVDLGRVDGRVFVNSASLGLYPWCGPRGGSSRSTWRGGPGSSRSMARSWRPLTACLSRSCRGHCAFSTPCDRVHPIRAFASCALEG